MAAARLEQNPELHSLGSERVTSQEEAEPGYGTPPTHDLLGLLLHNRRPASAFNQVWPGLYIGDVATAKNKGLLASLGVTHVLNAADGPRHIDTGAGFYDDTDIVYYGVEAADRKGFDLSPFFRPAAEFIHDALGQNGRVLVHCARGVSRSGALVLAFLVIRERLTLEDAVKVVCRHRNILPNAGFLRQLHQLDTSLAPERSRT